MEKNNKVALITGGSRGLGRSAALALAASGSDVVLTYRNEKEKAVVVVEEIKSLGRKAAAICLDVSAVAKLNDFTEELAMVLENEFQRDKLDVLVNNAGVGINVPFAQTSEAVFDYLMNVNLKGVFFLTQKVLPLLADGGRIINLSTGLTRFCLPGYGAYAAMKGAIEVLTSYLAKELGGRGIRVNVIAPGAIDTDFNKAALEAHPEMRNFIAAQTALGRIGEADDIGRIVALLCDDGGGWINAQRIEASGGMFL